MSARAAKKRKKQKAKAAASGAPATASTQQEQTTDQYEPVAAAGGGTGTGAGTGSAFDEIAEDDSNERILAAAEAEQLQAENEGMIIRMGFATRRTRINFPMIRGKSPSSAPPRFPPVIKQDMIAFDRYLAVTFEWR